MAVYPIFEDSDTTFKQDNARLHAACHVLICLDTRVFDCCHSQHIRQISHLLKISGHGLPPRELDHHHSLVTKINRSGSILEAACNDLQIPYSSNCPTHHSDDKTLNLYRFNIHLHGQVFSEIRTLTQQDWPQVRKHDYLVTTVNILILGNMLVYQDGGRFNSCQVIYSQFGLAIHQNDHQARRRFVEWAQNEIAVVPDFHKRILFSDEAHFWLNGYVNKQNCRIWSEANPQVYVETPLHEEKVTVWCTLWAGGILLQKRRRPQRYSQC
ncbi:hypothetical protein TNCV_1997171 [Trichonephila clavipes]|uniref:Uncharacterized protein n=1 Tax=Trichonephila clavipes TaxID=2585209 RepID=A0A8X6RMK8_TRICX|nr:hypothetical protein TNCV_1997171 [Trichonephila clavipes]